MTKQVQIRRGTDSQHTSFTGAEGEISVNTTNDSVHVHDGTTAGGKEMARADGSNVAFTSGTIDGTVIGGTTPAAGTFTTGDFNTSLNVDGTVTADGLTVDGNATIQNTGNSYRTISLDANRTASVNTLGRLNYKWDGNEVVRLQATSGSDTTNKDNGSFTIFTSDDGTLDQRLKIDSNGDISFYEDTGTTAKLFWDASAEALGIGGTPYGALTVDTANGILNIANGNTSGGTKIQVWGATPSNGYLAIEGYTKEYMRIDSSGNVIVKSGGELQLNRDDNARSMSLYTDNNYGTIETSTDPIKINAASGRIQFEVADTERMRIDSSGNVGIGTGSTVPTDRLVVQQDSTAIQPLLVLKNDNTTDDNGMSIDFSGKDTGANNITYGRIDLRIPNHATEKSDMRFYIRNDSGSFSETLRLTKDEDIETIQDARIMWRHQPGGTARASIEANSSDNIIFKTGSSLTERMRIDSSGNLLVGTTSATGKFNVTRNDNGVGAYIFASPSSGYTSSVFAAQGNQGTTNETYNLADFVNSTGSGRCKIYDSGDIDNTNGAYGSLSDVKLKTDIVDATSQWDDIKALRFRKYKMIADPDERVQMGLIAQELEATSPNLVKEVVDRDLEGNDLGTTTKSVKYSILYTKAVKALQEAMERIETLEAKVTALENA